MNTTPLPELQEPMAAPDQKNRFFLIRLFSNQKIGVKIGFSFAILILLVVVLGITNLSIAQVKNDAINELVRTQQELTLVEQVQVDVISMRQLEQQFLARLPIDGFESAYSTYFIPFQAHQNAIPTKILALRELELKEVPVNQVNLDILDRAEQVVPEYGSQFSEVVDALEKRGTRESGIEGEFRQALAELETAVIDTGNLRLQAAFAVMHSHDLNWQTDKDVAEVSIVRDLGDQFRELVSSSTMPASTMPAMQTKIDNYLTSFNNLVSSDIQVQGLLNRFDAKARAVDLPTDRIIESEQDDAQEALEAFQSAERLEQSVSLVVFLLAIIIGIALAIASSQNIVGPVSRLIQAAEHLSSGNLEVRAAVESNDEIGLMARTFNNMAGQLSQILGRLEQRVAERTRALETSAEVSRRLSTILDPQHLVLEVVNQIQQAFDYYHVHIYFFDEAREKLVMAGGTGEAGEAMLSKGHSIPQGKGLVGRAAKQNQVVLVPDVSQAEGWLPNPLLPETKAELAVPIAVGDEVLGVLDVQQNVIEGLTAEDVTLLQSLANQVAIAVQNARQYVAARQAAERESQINSINQRIQGAVTVESVLQIAAEELGQALGARRASVQLTNPARMVQVDAPENGTATIEKN